MFEAKAKNLLRYPDPTFLLIQVRYMAYFEIYIAMVLFLTF